MNPHQGQSLEHHPVVEEPMMEVPLISLLGTQLRVEKVEGVEVLAFGPLVIGVPLSPEIKEWIHNNTRTSSIVIATEVPS